MAGLRLAVTSPSLVGREAVLRVLRESFAGAVAGRLSVTLVEGEPGIGKSRLLDALALQATNAGAVVLRGTGVEAAGMPPYLPFLEALGSYVRGAEPEALLAQVGPHAAVLTALVPELEARLRLFPPSYPLPPDQARFRLFEAVAEVLGTVAGETGLLLVLDDLQWVDPASLDLLCHLARHQPGARILVAGAYRAGEAESRPEFGRAVAELTRLRVRRTVRLDPLRDADIALLAELELDGAIDSGLGRQLAAQSEGNPFFAEELLRSWQERGEVIARDGRWVLAATGQSSMPSGIAGAVQQRLARLPVEVVELLRSAAIIGRSFEVTLLAAVVGQEPEWVEAMLQPAVRAQVLAVAEADRYDFRHDKVRECLYAEVTGVRRRRLHGFIGGALEARTEPLDSQRLAKLAYHFARSGDRPRGADYARRAADDALRTFAPDEALGHYRTALDLCEPADPARGDVLMGLGEAADLAGAGEDAVAAFAAAQRLFHERGDRVAAARANHRLGQAWWRQERIDDARAAFEAAMALLENRLGPELFGVLVDLANLLAVSLHQYEPGLKHARRALALAEADGDPKQLAAARRTLGNLLGRSQDLNAGIAMIEAALAESADDPVEAGECCAYLAPLYFWRGEMRRSAEITRRRRAFAERCHDPYQLRHIDTWIAACEGIRGNLEESERLLNRAEATIERLASPEPRAYLCFCRGSMAHMQGDYVLAESLLRDAIAIFRQIGPGALVWYLGGLGWILARQQKLEEARACFDELEGMIESLELGTMPTAEPLAYLTQGALLLGDDARLARWRPLLERFAGQFNDMLIDRLLGEIALRQREWSVAEAHLARAEEIARREGLAWELPRTLEAEADLILARRDRDLTARTRALLTEAIGLIEAFGNLAEAERLRARLRELDRGTVRPLLPAGLSEREVEVLRLVAAGMSNRAIAEALSVSEKTVERHLTSLYGKIGAENRAAAVAFAIRHELA